MFAGFGCEEDPARPDPPPSPLQISLNPYHSTGTSEPLPNDDVYDIFLDSQSRVWIATEAGVWMQSMDTTRVFNQFDGIPNPRTRAVTELNGKIVVGTWGGGFAMYDGSVWQSFDTGDGLLNDQIWSVAADDSSVWLGTVDGIVQYVDDESRGVRQRFNDYSSSLGSSRVVRDVEVPPLLQSNPRRGPEIWIATENDGVVSLRLPSIYGMYGLVNDDDETEVYAVGDGGSVLSYNGSNGRWTQANSGTRSRLRGVWAASENAIHAVGENGTTRFFNGNTWLSRNSQTTEHLNAVWGFRPAIFGRLETTAPLSSTTARRGCCVRRRSKRISSRCGRTRPPRSMRWARTVRYYSRTDRFGVSSTCPRFKARRCLESGGLLTTQSSRSATVGPFCCGRRQTRAMKVVMVGR